MVEEDARKLGCRNWRTDVQDRGCWRHFLEEAKAHQGCRADDDDDDDDDDDEIPIVTTFHTVSLYRFGL